VKYQGDLIGYEPNTVVDEISTGLKLGIIVTIIFN